jgi:hypothetical protein
MTDMVNGIPYVNSNIKLNTVLNSVLASIQLSSQSAFGFKSAFSLNSVSVCSHQWP